MVLAVSTLAKATGDRDSKTFELHENIRNFCIIAHITENHLGGPPHSACDAVDQRKFQDQLLDSMILNGNGASRSKAIPVSLTYRDAAGKEYLLNLIDTRVMLIFHRGTSVADGL